MKKFLLTKCDKLVNTIIDEWAIPAMTYRVRLTGWNIERCIQNFYSDYINRKEAGTRLTMSMWKDTKTEEQKSKYGLDDSGRLFIRFKGTPMMIGFESEKKERNDSDGSYSYIVKNDSHYIYTLNTKIARQHVKDFAYWIHKKYSELGKLEISIRGSDNAETVYDLEERGWDSVFLEEAKKKEILDSIRKFKKSRDWFESHQIPYHFGIILEGTPRSGKSSMVRAIATEFKMNILSMSLVELRNFQESRGNTIILFEDIDTNPISWNREYLDILQEDTAVRYQHDKIIDPVKRAEQSRRKLEKGLGDILNKLDGIVNQFPGCIYIMTTNHVEMIDPALIGSGRIDLRVTFDHVTPEVLQQFIKYHYNVDLEIVNLCEGICVGELQHLVHMGKDWTDVCNYVRANVSRIDGIYTSENARDESQ
jgi:ATP-dependent 26S proteasome regulatory subunit